MALRRAACCRRRTDSPGAPDALRSTAARPRMTRPVTCWVNAAEAARRQAAAYAVNGLRWRGAAGAEHNAGAPRLGWSHRGVGARVAGCDGGAAPCCRSAQLFIRRSGAPPYSHCPRSAGRPPKDEGFRVSGGVHAKLVHAARDRMISQLNLRPRNRRNCAATRSQSRLAADAPIPRSREDRHAALESASSRLSGACLRDVGAPRCGRSARARPRRPRGNVRKRIRHVLGIPGTHWIGSATTAAGAARSNRGNKGADQALWASDPCCVAGLHEQSCS